MKKRANCFAGHFLIVGSTCFGICWMFGLPALAEAKRELKIEHSSGGGFTIGGGPALISSYDDAGNGRGLSADFRGALLNFENVKDMKEFGIGVQSNGAGDPIEAVALVKSPYRLYITQDYIVSSISESHSQESRGYRNFSSVWRDIESFIRQIPSINGAGSQAASTSGYLELDFHVLPDFMNTNNNGLNITYQTEGHSSNIPWVVMADGHAWVGPVERKPLLLQFSGGRGGRTARMMVFPFYLSREPGTVAYRVPDPFTGKRFPRNLAQIGPWSFDLDETSDGSPGCMVYTSTNEKTFNDRKYWGMLLYESNVELFLAAPTTVLGKIASISLLVNSKPVGSFVVTRRSPGVGAFGTLHAVVTQDSAKNALTTAFRTGGEIEFDSGASVFKARVDRAVIDKGELDQCRAQEVQARNPWQ